MIVEFTPPTEYVISTRVDGVVTHLAGGWVFGQQDEIVGLVLTKMWKVTKSYLKDEGLGIVDFGIHEVQFQRPLCDVRGE